MSKLLEDSIEIRAIYLNAKHLPQHEYDRLDMFLDYPNKYGVQAAVYSSGVVIYIEDYVREFVLEAGFPVLSEILLMAEEDDIIFVDFYEKRPTEIDSLKLYDWD